MIFNFIINKAHGMNETDDIRCHCGKLLAKRTPLGIELACKRCRRRLTIDLRALSVDFAEIELCVVPSTNGG